jgi:hypothetical protein
VPRVFGKMKQNSNHTLYDNRTDNGILFFVGEGRATTR